LKGPNIFVYDMDGIAMVFGAQIEALQNKKHISIGWERVWFYC